MFLGINIDHVAALRQARRTNYPELLSAADEALRSGADSITVHLREDRRHIQDQDVVELLQQLDKPLNLEIAATAEMLDFACQYTPSYCCLVPEKREELTTEGGLDVLANYAQVEKACQRLRTAGIRVSLFVEAVPEQLEAAAKVGAECVELHTGSYADATTVAAYEKLLQQLMEGAVFAAELGLQVHAGHGLNYTNVHKVAAIDNISELNIGHAVVARAIFVGMHHAVAELRSIIDTCTSATAETLPP